MATAALLAVGAASEPISAQATQDRRPADSTNAVEADSSRLVAPPDTYKDGPVQALVELAREARGANLRGIDHYEATLRERIYVGMGGRVFRRERGLFDQQRIARVRWDKSGDEMIQWLGLRARVPVLGSETSSAAEVESEIHEELSQEGEPIPISLDPGAFDLTVSEAVHPLADTAAQFYRYASGDTLFLTLPSDGRRVTMAEVRVEPREERFDLIAASLWFDIETGELVRAVYRPARPFNLEIDDPDEASDVPGFVKPIEAELKYITVEYGLYEFQYWLPRRFALEGEGRAGGFLRVPITLEWSMRDYLVNEDATELTEFAASLPPGWTRSERRVEDDGEVRYVTLLVPPADSVLNHPDLVERPLDSAPLEFNEDELAELRDVLNEIDPDLFRGPATLRYGIRDGLARFNRVEGLSWGARAEVPLNGRTTAYAEARLGVADLEPNGQLGIRRGDGVTGTHAAVYRRLAHTADFENPFDLPSSVSALLFGDDRAQYYRAWGAEVGWAGQTRQTRPTLRLFAERHSTAERETSFHLLKPLRSTETPENIQIPGGDFVGASGRVDWFSGTNPATLALFGRLGVEGGREFDMGVNYGRVFASVGATRELVGPLAGALEFGGGWATDDVPLQRAFYVGGAATLRGFETGSAVGSRFAFARAELATAFPAFRLSLFGDIADAAVADDSPFAMDPLVPSSSLLSWETAKASLGAGVSIMDGIFRLDAAWAVRNGSGFSFHAYLDGLF